MRIREIALVAATCAMLGLSACNNTSSDTGTAAPTANSTTDSATSVNADALTLGLVFDKDLGTYRFLLERNTSVVKVFLNSQGDLVGLNFLEFDKNFSYTINRKGDASIDCRADHCQIWHKDGTSTKIGSFDGTHVSFSQPIDWTSLISADAGGEDKPFARTALKIAK
jgi:hypothetical protein